MEELLAQFLIEGRELIQQASEDLLAMDGAGVDHARLDSAFRAVHTLKGSVGLFDLAPMGRALHAAEDLLDVLRRDGTGLAGFLDPLLACLSACEEWLDALEREGGLPPGAAEQASRIEAALRHSLPSGEVAKAKEDGADWAAPLIAEEEGAIAAAQAAGQTVLALRYSPAEDCFFLGDDPLAILRQVPELLALRVSPREPWPPAAEFAPFSCNLRFEALTTAPAEEVRRILRFMPDQISLAPVPVATAGLVEGSGEQAARFLRVDTGRVDHLLSVIGEMMVAKNALAALVERVAGLDRELGRALGERRQELDRLTGEAHRAIIGLRMVPLSQTFRRFPRLMREASSELGKPLVFDIQGEEVLADKAVADGLFQPLLHLLRNALDHGIEPVARRAAAGKPGAGRIRLEAARRGDLIVVTVTDDGAGIDPKAMREAAVRRGLLTAEAAQALDDTAAMELIFTPGFSTAARVTALSGRGVGMDAVRTAVEAMGGRVSLSSQLGQGTVARLSLPRAAVITTVITVMVRGEEFGVPIEGIAETLRLPRGAIEPIGGGEAFVLREKTVPLLRLDRLLGHEASAEPAGEMARLLVVTAGAQQVGIEVDAVTGRADVLLRPLSGLLTGVPGLQGTALQGDGRVLLVLDMAELLA
ncbi:chemotaxis protein CheA [Acetobacteraceae bacterium H6797]|nr:chemotaxis protein CheA [Acetobacteraceae bacterium H6797]